MPELMILRPINVTYYAGSHPRTSDTFSKEQDWSLSFSCTHRPYIITGLQL